MHRNLALMAVVLMAGCAAVPGTSPSAYAPHQFIPGGVYLDDRGPDGNTIILDAPAGLIVMDTGRHPAHAQQILDYVHSTGKPVAAIVNSHWHLDHTTGNMDILAAYPGAQIVASHAIEGRLFRDFIGPQQEAGRKALADGSAPAARRPSMERAQRFLNDLKVAIPTQPVEHSGPMTIAGRKLDVRLAPFAASEGDVWVVVPEERLVLSGDLVVDIVPFMDTACVKGWSRALDEIAAVDFDTLIPGHGSPMSKAQFLQWKGAFDSFVDCGHSSAAAETCVNGWMANAAPFIDDAHKGYARDAAGYYLDTRLRSKPEEQDKFCAVPKA